MPFGLFEQWALLARRERKKRVFTKARKLLFGEVQATHRDVAQNIYEFRFICYCLFFYTLETILNEAEIFIVDKHLFRMGFLAVWAVAIGYGLVLRKLKFESEWTKYVGITAMVAMITAANVALTYHMIMIVMLPIIVAGMYESKPFRRYTFALVLASIVVSTYGGYFFGLCDANMVLLTVTSLAKLSHNGIFTMNQINPAPGITLALFYVLPRWLMAVSFLYVSNIVNEVLRKSHRRVVQDAMTGLYNKNELVELMDEHTYDGKDIGVMYWDVNRLKYVNDTFGHAAGDQLITRVAQTIGDVTDGDGVALRYGGDEFIAIFPGADAEAMTRVIWHWNELIAALQKESDYPVSAAVGYALGKGEDLKKIIAAADEEMYHHKQSTR